MSELMAGNLDTGRVAELSGQDRMDYEALATVLREIVSRRYKGQLEEAAIASHVEDMARRLSADISTLGQDQYRRVQQVPRVRA